MSKYFFSYFTFTFLCWLSFTGHEQLQSPQEPLPLMKLRKPIKTANAISNAIIIVAINIILQLFLDYLM